MRREVAARERAERDLEELKQELEAREGDVKEAAADLAASEAAIARMEHNLREQEARHACTFFKKLNITDKNFVLPWPFFSLGSF
jgi:septal ring factor EnvC (AmiA/AmiB activator)